MNRIRSSTNTLINLDIMSIVMFCLSLVLLSTIILDGNIAPILLYICMIIVGALLITFFSNKDETFLKTKLFIFFFSLILFYTLLNHYILVEYFPKLSPFLYVDGPTFYKYSNLALPYISGKKNLIDLLFGFPYPMHDVSLHVLFSSSIAYFSVIIDGNNNIIVQKLLSPFLGGLFSVVLYSTLNYQFKDRTFALIATFAYTLLSAIFIYSTSLMRDIDVALAYIIFIYLFLQKNSFINLLLLLLVAYITTYLRTESGMILFGLILLYSYLNIRKLQSRSLKLIFYILLMIFFTLVILFMYHKIMIMITERNAVNLARSTAQASSGSIGLLLNKLPFPLNSFAKVSFGQIQPFPFFIAIDRPPEAISGIFWPFIFIMMLYALIKKNIRILLDEKVKYLLMAAIAILFLMSSEPMARRMMSVYPIIYIVSLYAFIVIPNNDIKRFFSYYMISIISLNVFYYLIKI